MAKFALLSVPRLEEKWVVPVGNAMTERVHRHCGVQPVCPIIQLFWDEAGTEIRTRGEHDDGFDQ